MCKIEWKWNEEESGLDESLLVVSDGEVKESGECSLSGIAGAAT